MPIFDQGYQHWKGHLAGHAWRWLAIARHGMRTQFKAWYVRLLLIMAWAPAFTLAAVLAIWGMLEQGVLGADSWIPWFLTMLAKADDMHACRQAVWTIAYSYFFWIELYFVMLIVTLVGPNLISRDLRFNALPLYLSRPLTRYDYFFGKLGMIAGIVAAVAVLPAMIAYVLGVCFSLDLSVVSDTWRLLPASIIYGTVIVLSAGTLMLALSSLSRRSIYVGLAWIGIWLISNIMAWILIEAHRAIIVHEAIQAHERAGYIQRMPRPLGAQGRAGVNYAIDKSVRQSLAEAAKTDWLPLFSYPRNIMRLGEAALDTDAAWVKVGHVMNSSQSEMSMMLGASAGRWPTEMQQTHDDRFLADQFVPQYPWTWSAGVLAGILGLSVWILSMRVKSLDSLK